ncbi:MAG: class I SAM-dependent rRNA methyltransferase [Proteobacteria bacterium]|nr:MAG: class I SAM-dependent rRNA methyltransferase [Pseudomonadota bacterium]
MPRYPKLVLKPNRERSLKRRHPWIFSGAIEGAPKCEDGSIMQVYDADGNCLGCGYFNSRCSIAVRMLSFGKQDPIEALRDNIRSAISFRRALFDASTTDAVRLINSEGDGIPGLIADLYKDVLVIQISTLGIEKLREEVLETLHSELKPRTILEKSHMAARNEEGLDLVERHLVGEEVEEVIIKENGFNFAVNFRNSQKTGFFLDQRSMRRRCHELSRTLAQSSKILNCFSFSGGFSVYAAAAGAGHVESVDTSKAALELAKRNFELNQIDADKHAFIESDVFDYLRECSGPYDLIILDPPAFAKARSEVKGAERGYRDINHKALGLLKAGGVLITCSCSYFLDAESFQRVVFEAAASSGRVVQIIGRHDLAPDHPISLFHPEGSYLKSLVLRAS